MVEVTHAPDDSMIGKRFEFPEWRGIEGLMLDCGTVDDYWWDLIESDGRFYVGLPGLEVYIEIGEATRDDREALDAVIESLLDVLAGNRGW